jgi:hypothetical protein
VAAPLVHHLRLIALPYFDDAIVDEHPVDFRLKKKLK